MRCVEIDLNGFLVDANTSIESCTSFVLMNSSEWSQYPTLLDIFTMPLAEDIGQAFVLGFSPVLVFTAAWTVGLLLKMFKAKHNQ